MTWANLKKFVDQLTPEQLKQKVCFQDDYDNLLHVKSYVADGVITGREGSAKVRKGMPYIAM